VRNHPPNPGSKDGIIPSPHAFWNNPPKRRMSPGFYADARNCRILRHIGPVSDLTLGLCLNAIDEVLLALLDTTEDPQHA